LFTVQVGGSFVIKCTSKKENSTEYGKDKTII